MMKVVVMGKEEVVVVKRGSRSRKRKIFYKAFMSSISEKNS